MRKKYRSNVIIDELDLILMKSLVDNPLLMLEVDKELGIARKNTLIHIKRLKKYGLINVERVEGTISWPSKVSITKKGKKLIEII